MSSRRTEKLRLPPISSYSSRKRSLPKTEHSLEKVIAQKNSLKTIIPVRSPNDRVSQVQLSLSDRENQVLGLYQLNIQSNPNLNIRSSHQINTNPSRAQQSNFRCLDSPISCRENNLYGLDQNRYRLPQVNSPSPKHSKLKGFNMINIMRLVQNNGQNNIQQKRLSPQSPYKTKTTIEYQGPNKVYIDYEQEEKSRNGQKLQKKLSKNTNGHNSSISTNMDRERARAIRRFLKKQYRRQAHYSEDYSTFFQEYYGHTKVQQKDSSGSNTEQFRAHLRFQIDSTHEQAAPRPSRFQYGQSPYNQKIVQIQSQQIIDFSKDDEQPKNSNYNPYSNKQSTNQPLGASLKVPSFNGSDVNALRTLKQESRQPSGLPSGHSFLGMDTAYQDKKKLPQSRQIEIFQNSSVDESSHQKSNTNRSPILDKISQYRSSHEEEKAVDGYLPETSMRHSMYYLRENSISIKGMLDRSKKIKNSLKQGYDRNKESRPNSLEIKDASSQDFYDEPAVIRISEYIGFLDTLASNVIQLDEPQPTGDPQNGLLNFYLYKRYYLQKVRAEDCLRGKIPNFFQKLDLFEVTDSELESFRTEPEYKQILDLIEYENAQVGTSLESVLEVFKVRFPREFPKPNVDISEDFEPEMIYYLKREVDNLQRLKKNDILINGSYTQRHRQRHVMLYEALFLLSLIRGKYIKNYDDFNLIKDYEEYFEEYDGIYAEQILNFPIYTPKK